MSRRPVLGRLSPHHNHRTAHPSGLPRSGLRVIPRVGPAGAQRPTARPPAGAGRTGPSALFWVFWLGAIELALLAWWMF